MTADQIIEVLQAWKDGNPLQWRIHESEPWIDYEEEKHPEEFFYKEWRVKPHKLREWWIAKYNNGGLATFPYEDIEMLYKCAQLTCVETIHVREVVKE